MAGYAMLLWREARQAAPTAAVYLLGILVWTAFLGTRIGRWHDGVVLALALAPLVTLPVWALWRVFHGLRQDYATPHAHLLLALPIPGWQLASAKVLVIWAEVTVYALAAGAGILFLLRAIDLPGLPPVLSPNELGLVEDTVGRSAAAAGLLALLFGAPAWLSLAQAAWVVGRAFPRGRGPVSVLAFLAGAWLLLRAGIAARSILGWLPHWALFPYPDIIHLGHGEWAVEPRLLAIHPAPLIGVAVAAITLFALTARLLEQSMEADTGVGRAVIVALALASFVAVGADVHPHGFGIVDRLLEAFSPDELRPGP